MRQSIFKIITLSILISGWAGAVQGQQNYVPNGNFEYYNTNSCPYSHSQMNRCTGWRQYTYGTSDFFHACGYGVPNAIAGYQMPASGNGFSGGFQYSKGHTFIYKEYIARAITPLMIGGTYEVSMSVSLGNSSRYGTNDLGVFFYDSGPLTINTSNVLGVTPQVSYSSYGPIMDTANWVRLVGEFIADSSYDNIVIGGFTHYNQLGLDSNGVSGTYAYYYFDSVVVRLIDSFNFIVKDSILCAGDTIQLPYYTLRQFPANNTFTFQLSNASGSFSSPVNIGSLNSDTSGVITCVIPPNTSTGSGYKIRLLALTDTAYSKTTFDIGSPFSKPVAVNNGPVCGTDTLQLNVSTTNDPAAQIYWQGPNNFSIATRNPIIPQPLAAYTGDYIVTVTVHGCTGADTTSAIVLNSIDTTYTYSNTPLCTGDTLQLNAILPATSLTVSWTGPNSFSSTQLNPSIPSVGTSHSGNYVLTISNGACVVKDTAIVTVFDYPAGVSASSNSPVCAGQNLNFNATSTSSGVAYNWTGPIGFNSTSASPYIIAATTGSSGYYYLTASVSTCAVTDTLAVTVKPLPGKPLAGAPDTMCSGTAALLTASSSTGGVSYSWVGPGSFTSNVQNPVINNTTTAMSGNYIVSATLNGCSSKDTTSLAIYQSPDTVQLSSNSPVCVGDMLQLSSDSSSSGVTYTWRGPNSFNAAQPNTSISNTTTTATGWYTMTIDLYGCSYIDSIYAVVNIVPATPSISTNKPLCTGETLTLNAGTVSGASYLWTGPGSYSSGVQNAARANLSLSDSGYYKISATIANCTSPADSVFIPVSPAPFVVIFSTPIDSICKGDPVTFTALPNNAGSTPEYRWVVNGQTAGTNSTVFATTNLNDNDVIRCDMTENTKCSSPYTDQSNDIPMRVLPWLPPSVTISANPNRPLKPYEYVTFTAVTTDAGLSPLYQWKRNGQNILGATSGTWSANTLDDGDSISVEIISDYKCPQPTTAVSNGIRVKVLTSADHLNTMTALTLYPNPNNGKFVLKGNVTSDGPLRVEIINALGQVVYQEKELIFEGRLHKEIEMDNTPGIYLLRIFSQENTAQVKFIIH